MRCVICFSIEEVSAYVNYCLVNIVHSYSLLTFGVSIDSIMILSFGNKETEKIWKGNLSRKLPREIQDIARRKLRMINNSVDIVELRIPPSNRLEKLKGVLSDFYSIRINNQWRIIFRWENGNTIDVEIVDYH